MTTIDSMIMAALLSCTSRNGPLGTEDILIQAMDCRENKCKRNKCSLGDQPECMAKITAEMVLDKARVSLKAD